MIRSPFCGYNVAYCVELLCGANVDRFTMLFKQNLTRWFKKMSTYLSDSTVTTFLRVLPTRRQRKPAGIDTYDITSVSPMYQLLPRRKITEANFSPQKFVSKIYRNDEHHALQETTVLP